MGWRRWEQNAKKFFNSAAIIQPFHMLTATLLTLLLPLSFLLLSRLSTANYLLSLTLSSQTQPRTISVFLFSQIIPIILYALVSFISILTLIHGFIGSQSQEPFFKPPLYLSWVLLCIFQVSVGLGVEGSLAVVSDDSGFDHEISLISRVVFFLGLHESVTYWWRTVVKPVVDDTVLGFRKEERWVEKAALAVGFGGLWWWRLRGEVESLVIMVQVKNELLMDVAVGDFIGWWLYYLTVTIGMVKFAKLVLWFAVILLVNRVERNVNDSFNEIDDKV